MLEETENKFQVYGENGFLVLPDGKTVVSADMWDSKKLVMEDITEVNPTQIGTHSDKISSLLFHNLTQSLLVGNIEGDVKQYKRNNGSFTFVKDYRNLGVGQVLSSAQVGPFVIFGGNNHSLVAIDLKNQTVIKGFLKTAYKGNKSLQVCFTNYHRVFLSVSGYDPDFSSGKSNFFDVTCMTIKNPSSLKNFPYNDLSQANQTILVQQMDIESLKEKIEELKKYKSENDMYKQKLKEAWSKYQSLKTTYESIKIQNESIRDKFLLLKPEIDTKNKRLNHKLFIIDKLRRQYTHKLHDTPEFSFFDKKDQAKQILDLENKIMSLNNQISINFESLQKSTGAQIRTEKENQLLKAKKRQMEKQLLIFRGFIEER